MSLKQYPTEEYYWEASEGISDEIIANIPADDPYLGDPTTTRKSVNTLTKHSSEDLWKLFEDIDENTLANIPADHPYLGDPSASQTPNLSAVIRLQINS